MSKRSRERFRPPWQGKFNPSRDRYAQGFTSDKAFDDWWSDWERGGMLCPECRMPERAEYPDVHAYLRAVEMWETYRESWEKNKAACKRCYFEEVRWI